MKQWRKSSRFRKAYKKVMESKSSRNAVRLYRLECNKPVFKKHEYDYIGWSNIFSHCIFKLIGSLNRRNYFTLAFPKNLGDTVRTKQNKQKKEK